MRMKTNVRCISLNAQAKWHKQVELQLAHLQSLAAITSADVVFEHDRDVTPAFRVRVSLEVPGPVPGAKASLASKKRALRVHGPAYESDVRENTLEAALLKATRDLERQIRARSRRTADRGRSQLQLSGMASRWTHSQLGHAA